MSSHRTTAPCPGVVLIDALDIAGSAVAGALDARGGVLAHHVRRVTRREDFAGDRAALARSIGRPAHRRPAPPSRRRRPRASSPWPGAASPWPATRCSVTRCSPRSTTACGTAPPGCTGAPSNPARPRSISGRPTGRPDRPPVCPPARPPACPPARPNRDARSMPAYRNTGSDSHAGATCAGGSAAGRRWAAGRGRGQERGSRFRAFVGRLRDRRVGRRRRRAVAVGLRRRFVEFARRAQPGVHLSPGATRRVRPPSRPRPARPGSGSP